MVAKAALHLLAVTAFAVLAGAGLSAGSARAQDTACLTAPKGAAPAGTHWFYKTDPATHQKCWYTRPQEQAAAPASALGSPSRTALERGDTANPDSDGVSAPEESIAPVALAPAPVPPVPERTATPSPAAPRRAAAPVTRIPIPTKDPRGERQPVTTAASAMPTPAVPSATADNVAWPDPPSMPQAAGATGSPFPPPPPNMSSQADPSGLSAAAPASGVDTSSVVASPVPSATGQPPAGEKPESAGAPEKADADNPTAAKPPGRVSVLLVLGGLIVLLIAGMLLRRIVEHALSRRRVIKLARQEPRLVEPVAVPPPMPTLLRQAPSVVPGHAQAAQRATEVEAELRKFALNLRQHRPAANSTANGTIGRTGTALRS